MLRCHQPVPRSAGGLAVARWIATLAGAQGIPCTIGSNLEWDIGTAAMLHLVVATPNMQVERYPGDCLGPYYHEFSIALNPLPICGPCITLHQRPGLGIDVDGDAVSRNKLR